MSSPLSSPPRPHTAIHRVAIVFAGGPAPAANAVISAAADSFMRNGIQVVGILNGYSNLMQFSSDRPLRGRLPAAGRRRRTALTAPEATWRRR